MATVQTLDLAANAAAQQIRRGGGRVHIDHQTGPYLPNGQSVSQRHVNRLIERGELVPDVDGLFDDQPQTYHLKTEVTDVQADPGPADAGRQPD